MTGDDWMGWRKGSNSVVVKVHNEQVANASCDYPNIRISIHAPPEFYLLLGREMRLVVGPLFWWTLTDKGNDRQPLFGVLDSGVLG
jgi:hypothetical protein